MGIVKVLCCHCFPISEMGEVALWKDPRLRLFALSPTSLRKRKLPKEALNICSESFLRKLSLHIFSSRFIVNTLRFHYKDQSVNVRGRGDVLFNDAVSCKVCIA